MNVIEVMSGVELQCVPYSIHFECENCWEKCVVPFSEVVFNNPNLPWTRGGKTRCPKCGQELELKGVIEFIHDDAWD